MSNELKPRGPLTTFDYLRSAETTRPRELAFGWVREPPSPFFSHQELVLRVARLLGDYVEPRQLGRIAIAPLDVILDADQHLIVQPDVLFVSAGRLSIIRNQVWGAPDLVVEVLSTGIAAYDRGEKMEWYRRYGVRECWLVDLHSESVAVVDFSGTVPNERLARGGEPIQSSVLPSLGVTPAAIFAGH